MAKIMTVEDSEFERELIKRYLAKGGYKEIIEAESAEKAIKKYKKERPDLVLMDVRLPGMDGLECFEKLKKINPLVKVIALTIVLRKDAIDKAKRLGVKDYIVKPIKETELLDSVKKVLKE